MMVVSLKFGSDRLNEELVDLYLSVAAVAI